MSGKAVTNNTLDVNETKDDQTNLFTTAGFMDPDTNAIVITVLSLVVIPGNILVLLTVWKNKNLQTASNIFLTNLAVVDLLVGVFGLIRVLSYVLEEAFDHALLCVGLISGTLVLLQTSGLIMVGIAVDRFLAVYKALRYQAIVTPYRVHVAMATVWAYTLSVFYLAPLAGWHTWTPGLRCHLTQSYSISFHFIYCIHILTDVFIFTVLYFFIFFVSIRHRHQIGVMESGGNSVDAAVASLKGHLRAAKTLLLVTGIFACTVVPPIVYLCRTIANRLGTGEHGIRLRNALSGVLVAANSAANPFIYGRFLPAFREGFRKVLCCKADDNKHSSTSTEQVAVT